MQTALNNGHRSPRKLLRTVVARLLGGCAELQEGTKTESLLCIPVYLEVTLVNGQNYSIPVEEGNSVEQELDLFLARQGRYASEWVPLMKAGRELFVRYEQIALVSPIA